MPEKRFEIVWPNGQQESCYSPSSVIEQHLAADQTYSVKDFVDVTERALNEASERVRKKYGYACSSALNQLAQIKQTAAQFDQPQSQYVTVKSIR